jgi:hypothetical protein
MAWLQARQTELPDQGPDLIVTASGTSRQLNAQISSSNAGKKASWTINWEAYQ